MKENRTVAKWFAGLMMVGTIVVGGFAPAQAADTGWGGTVAPSDGTSVITTPTATTTTLTVTKTNITAKDTGWGGT